MIIKNEKVYNIPGGKIMNRIIKKSLMTLALGAMLATTSCANDSKAEGLMTSQNVSMIWQINYQQEETIVPLYAFYGGVDEAHYEWSVTFKDASELKASYFTVSSELSGKSVVGISQVTSDNHAAGILLTGTCSSSATEGFIFVSPEAFSSTSESCKGATIMARVRIGNESKYVEKY